MSIQLYFDERQLAHRPVRELHNGSWIDYSEKAERAEMIRAGFAAAKPVADHGIEPIARVHSPDYIAFLQTAYADWQAAGRDGDAIGYTWPVVGRRDLRLDRIDARLGRYSYDAGTPIGPATWDAAYWSAQSALTALDAVLDGDEAGAFALCRPPGHHAGRDYLGGYCYLNNAAIAAADAHARGRRVAILDVDYHHGNGTQDIFLDSGEVLFASIHADPATDYPFYWGHADERGTGAGEGKTLNLPLPRGTKIGAYLEALEAALAAIRAHGTDLLLLSFGADTYESDPISHFRLRRDDFAVLGERIARLGIATVIVMEGGYAVGDLGANVERFVGTFGRANFTRTGA